MLIRDSEPCNNDNPNMESTQVGLCMTWHELAFQIGSLPLSPESSMFDSNAFRINQISLMWQRHEDYHIPAPKASGFKMLRAFFFFNSPLRL